MTLNGAYFGNDPAQLAAYEAWLGQDVDHVLFYLNDWTWRDFDSSINWAVNLWKPSNEPVIWSVPLVVSGSTLAQSAAGDFNSHFLKAATAIAQSRTDSGPIYVRVGWEFNGDWMPWSARGKEAAFIGAFQELVDVFRSVSNKFKFVWDVNLGGTYNPALAYPGDNYVDVIGMDFYSNKQWDPADPLAAFQSKVTQKYGLQWQQDFAAAHGKQTAISEWGVNTDDMGAYIRAAAQWFEQNHMVYQNYWESDYANYKGTMHDGSKPNVAEIYRDIFGPQAPTIETPLHPPVIDDGLVLRGGSGNDRFVVNDARAVIIDTGGIDTVRASVNWVLGEGIENLSLTGSAVVGRGNALDNVITGNAVNNVLYGYGGNDTMTGGAGRDTFVFDTAPNSRNVDHIRAFSRVDDTIRLDGDVFKALHDGRLASHAFKDVAHGKVDANDRIIYDSDSGVLTYDSNGSKAGGRVTFAVIDNDPVLTHADFFVV